MCLLTVFPPHSVIDRERLINGTTRNADGHGFALVKNNEIHWGHAMSGTAAVDGFIDARAEHNGTWALFHSRLTTHGTTTVDNCHPFIVGGDARTVLAHNGILPEVAQPVLKDPRSDTRVLAEDLIPGYAFGALHKRRAQRRLRQWLTSEGYPNKVAILTVDPRFRQQCIILNEEAGEWVDGVWYSNSSYLPRRSFTSSYWGTGWGTGGGGTGWAKGRASALASCLHCPNGVVSEFTGLCLYCRACQECGFRNCVCHSVVELGHPQEVTPRLDGCKGTEGCTGRVSTVLGYCTKCRVCVDCGGVVTHRRESWLNEYQYPCDCYIPESFKNHVLEQTANEVFSNYGDGH